MGYSFRNHVNYFYDYQMSTLYLSAQQNMLKIQCAQQVYRDFALFYSDIVRQVEFEPDETWVKRQRTYLDWLLKLNVLYLRAAETRSIDDMLYRLVRRFSASPDDEYRRIVGLPIAIEANDADLKDALTSSLKNFGYFRQADDDDDQPPVSIRIIEDHRRVTSDIDVTLCFDPVLPSAFRTVNSDHSGPMDSAIWGRINRLSNCSDVDFVLGILPAMFPFFLTLFLLPAVPAEALVFDERNYPIYVSDSPDQDRAGDELRGSPED